MFCVAQVLRGAVGGSMRTTESGKRCAIATTEMDATLPRNRRRRCQCCQRCSLLRLSALSVECLFTDVTGSDSSDAVHSLH